MQAILLDLTCALINNDGNGCNNRLEHAGYQDVICFYANQLIVWHHSDYMTWNRYKGRQRVLLSFDEITKQIDRQQLVQHQRWIISSMVNEISTTPTPTWWLLISYIYTFRLTHTHSHTHTYTCALMHSHKYTHTHAHTLTHTHTHAHIHAHTKIISIYYLFIYICCIQLTDILLWHIYK